MCFGSCFLHVLVHSKNTKMIFFWNFALDVCDKGLKIIFFKYNHAKHQKTRLECQSYGNKNIKKQPKNVIFAGYLKKLWPFSILLLSDFRLFISLIAFASFNVELEYIKKKNCGFYMRSRKAKFKIVFSWTKHFDCF